MFLSVIFFYIYLIILSILIIIYVRHDKFCLRLCHVVFLGVLLFSPHLLIGSSHLSQNNLERGVKLNNNNNNNNNNLENISFFVIAAVFGKIICEVDDLGINMIVNIQCSTTWQMKRARKRHNVFHVITYDPPPPPPPHTHKMSFLFYKIKITFKFSLTMGFEPEKVIVNLLT